MQQRLAQAPAVRADGRDRGHARAARPLNAKPRKESPVNTIVIEHVPVADLPEKWRAKLAKAAAKRATSRA